MSNNARVRQSKGKWASDEDAGDLLAGILDDTAADAEAEQRRIEAELRKREEEEQRKREEDEQRKLMEAEQRLQSEQQRQSQLQQRRTEKMEALRIEDLKARGEWVEPPKPEPKAEEPRAAVAAAPVAAAPVAAAPVPLAQQHAPTPEAHSGGGNASKILAAVFALVIVAGGVAFGVIQGQYKADTQAYAKTIIAPVDAPDLTAVAAVTFLAEEKPEAAPEETKKPTKRRYRPRRSSKKPKKPGKGGLNLGDTGSLLGDL